MKNSLQITGPTLMLDEQKCRQNIQFMAEKAKKSHVAFRPHFKTHQSLEIGRWFKEAGVGKITVSSLEMATYFAAEWDDITLAFPVNILEIDGINELAGKINLNLLLESTESAEFLAKHMRAKAGYFLKIDAGYHRTGIQPDNMTMIEGIIEIIEKSEALSFKGFLVHSGHTYTSGSPEEVLTISRSAIHTLKALKLKFKGAYPELTLSLGDTPSCSIADDFTGIDEIRPGNFVFYDLTQYAIGSASINQIAVAMACPVVAIHKERSELVIYGGAVHFSKDSLQTGPEGIIFGRVVENRGNTWGDILPGQVLVKLSQEHGTVKVPAKLINTFHVGQVLYILPVHSCLTANLMKYYMTTEGKNISKWHY